MAVQGTLSASNQTAAELGSKLDISLSGTWTGTVKLQRFMSGAWQDTGDSWTANAQVVVEGASPLQYRLDWTRTSGDLVYHLIGATPV